MMDEKQIRAVIALAKANAARSGFGPQVIEPDAEEARVLPVQAIEPVVDPLTEWRRAADAFAEERREAKRALRRAERAFVQERIAEIADAMGAVVDARLAQHQDNMIAGIGAGVADLVRRSEVKTAKRFRTLRSEVDEIRGSSGGIKYS
jgi:predicted component of type VI protein secretion system